MASCIVMCMRKKTPRKQGIYLLTHIPTGNTYVGQSTNIARRWHDHRSKLRHGARLEGKTHDPIPDWKFEILELVDDPSMLLAKEYFWIHELGATLNVLDLRETNGGQKSAQGRKDNFLTDSKIDNKYRRYYLVGPDGTEYCTDNLTAFAEEFGLERRNLFAIALGKRGRRTHKGWTCSYIEGNEVPVNREQGRKFARNRRQFRLIDPSGNVYTCDNLNKFCKEHGLKNSQLTAVASGRFKSHQGWRCEYLPD